MGQPQTSLVRADSQSPCFIHALLSPGSGQEARLVTVLRGSHSEGRRGHKEAVLPLRGASPTEQERVPSACNSLRCPC